MSESSARRSFAAAQRAWDNATPDDDDDRTEEEIEAAKNSDCYGCRKRSCSDCPV